MMNSRTLCFAFIVATTLCQLVFSGSLADIRTVSDSMKEDKRPTATVVTETARSNTLSNRIVDCPQGWVYAGDLGCFYFNTQADKVKAVFSGEYK